MVDQVTSVVKSRRLRELGVPAQNASLRYISNPFVANCLCYTSSVWGASSNCLPAYSTYDLLKLLPARLKIGTLQVEKGVDGYRVYYRMPVECDPHTFTEVSFSATSLIDALFSMVEYMLQCGEPLLVHRP